MQFSSDTALAAAIAADHRTFAAQLLIDWGGTGLYDHAYSDLSVLVDESATDRSLVGDVPDEVNLVEGYQSAKLTAYLAGTRPGDALSIGEILSPYRPDSPMFGLLNLGVRVKYSIVVGTGEGPKTIRQFTGRVRGIDVDDTGRTMVLGADYSELLRKAISVRPWAMDSVGRAEDYPDHVQQIFPQWVIDHILRQCDIYQSPPLASKLTNTATVMFSATLHGAFNAEVGDTLEFEHAIDVKHNSMWTQGQFGLAANAVPADYSMYSYFTPFAVPWPEGWSVATGAWIYGPRATALGTTEILFCWMNNDNSELRFRITDAGVLSARLVGTSGYNVTFTGPTVPAGPAWHYVGVSLRRMGASGMEAKFTVDGVNTTVTSATVYPQFASTVIQQNLVQIQVGMPTQCVQMWVITTGGTLAWPKDLITSANDLIPGSVLDMGTNGMTRIPDIYQADAWETLREVVGAEYGLLWLDEFGTVRFADRTTVRTPALADDRTITLDHLNRFAVHDIADGIRNRYTFSVVQGVTYQNVSVFRATQDLEFDAPPESTTVFRASVLNAQYTGRKSMLVVSPWPDADDWIQAGWHAVQRGTATDATGVEVSVYPIDQRTIAIQVMNPNTYWLRFISGASNRPAMRIDGRQVTEELPRVGSVQHDGSIALYSERVFEIPSTPWRSYLSSIENLARSLLRDTHTSIPTIDRIPVLGDPRSQLRDSVVIDTTRFGRMLGVMQGINRTLSKSGGLVDDLTIRVTHPGGSWVLGDPVMSELGVTTVLS